MSEEEPTEMSNQMTTGNLEEKVVSNQKDKSEDPQ